MRGNFTRKSAVGSWSSRNTPPAHYYCLLEEVVAAAAVVAALLLLAPRTNSQWAVGLRSVYSSGVASPVPSVPSKRPVHTTRVVSPLACPVQTHASIEADPILPLDQAFGLFVAFCIEAELQKAKRLWLGTPIEGLIDLIGEHSARLKQSVHRKSSQLRRHSL